jgi:hypothetical protein
VAPDGSIVSVAVTQAPGGGATLGLARKLFAPGTSGSFDYAVTSDGQRFLVNGLVEQPPEPISIVINRRTLGVGP